MLSADPVLILPLVPYSVLTNNFRFTNSNIFSLKPYFIIQKKDFHNSLNYYPELKTKKKFNHSNETYIVFNTEGLENFFKKKDAFGNR